MHLFNLLMHNWQSNAFAHAWIIHSNDSSQALEVLLRFCNQAFDFDSNIVSNSDLFIVKRQLQAKSSNDNKFITVDQIREMLSFLNNTPINHSVKVAIIYEAEYMNINAANCCLKILEDSSLTTSYLFLVSSKLTGIIPTVRARCRIAAVSFHYTTSSTVYKPYSKEYQQLINMLDSTTKSTQLNLIDKLRNTSPNSLEWKNFCNACLELIIRAISYKTASDVGEDNHITNYTADEMQIIKKLCANNSIDILYRKCNFLGKIVENTNNFELDMRNTAILALSVLQNQYNI